jgi:ferredoxin
VVRIEFDQNVCIGSGICESIADDIFRIGDDGLMSLRVDEVGDVRREQIEQAVSRCPTAAIRIAASM